MHQLLLGASIPMLIAFGIYLARGRRASLPWLVLTPLAAGAGAMWAVIPDIPRALGLHTLYLNLSNAPWTNIFFWHYTIDRIEHLTLERVTPLFTLVLTALILALLGVALRELTLREEER
jgi:hypothetical protein